MSKPKYDLSIAELKAQPLFERLQQVCTRVEIVGSIRRRKPKVSDIEFLIIPMQTYDMFQAPMGYHPAYLEMMGGFIRFSRKMREEGKIKCDRADNLKGKADGKNLLLWYDGIPIDIFVANEQNWGNQKRLRTGSTKFNFEIDKVLKKQGMTSKDGFIFANGKYINTPTEKMAFDIMNIDYIEPQDRSVPESQWAYPTIKIKQTA